MSQTPTPCPWRLDGGIRFSTLRGYNGELIARVASPANGDLIVQAVNAHDTLVALARLVLATAEKHSGNLPPDAVAHLYNQAESALRLARAGRAAK